MGADEARVVLGAAFCDVEDAGAAAGTCCVWREAAAAASAARLARSMSRALMPPTRGPPPAPALDTDGEGLEALEVGKAPGMVLEGAGGLVLACDEPQVAVVGDPMTVLKAGVGGGTLGEATVGGIVRGTALGRDVDEAA